MEVKSSWIDASTLADPSGYITVQAEVPALQHVQPEFLNAHRDAHRTARADGMHVMGSVNGHPEMIWATFEHFGNAPDEACHYLTVSGGTNTVSRSTAGN
ncbi:MAG: hypothetical protein JO227_05810 [Acetobacteraceae bacterium]|nr:hypothetical protein [Acetobacteraceae bacterium]